MRRRDWLRRMGWSLPFLPTLPGLLSRVAPRVIYLEWEERNLAIFANVVRLSTGEMRAMVSRVHLSAAIQDWRGWVRLHKAVALVWMRAGAPLTQERVADMRELLAKPEAARFIRELARRP